MTARRKQSGGKALVFAGIVATVLVMAVRVRFPELAENMAELIATVSQAPDSVVIKGMTATNTYGTSDGISTGPGKEYPYFLNRLLVEPSRETTLEILLSSDQADIISVQWSIAKIESSASRKLLSQSETVSTTSFIWTPPAVGDYTATVIVQLTDDSMVEFTKSIACRYVRREIRTLSSIDRDLYFDSFKTTMDIGTSAGMKLYGEKYKDLQHFLELHLNLAGNKKVDQLHDGMGFATQHSALTAAFEEILQMIDPTVTIPYWDYTLDHHLAAQAATDEDRIAALWRQEVWTEAFFGVAEGPYRTIEKGRFAYTTIAKNHTAKVRSPYGYLRAPWNCNKDPFLMRSHAFCDVNYEWGASSLTASATPTTTTWPSCEVHWQLTFDVSSLSDWVWDAGYAPHGPVHFMIGGYSHCGDLYEMIPALDPLRPMRDGSLPDPEEAQNRSRLLGVLKQMAIVFPKTLWRNDLVEYPEVCSDDTPQELCHMICKDSVDNEAYRDFILGNGADFLFGDWIDDLPMDLHGQFLKAICTTPWTPGEQLEAASPVDVSFWPIHPTMERLLTWKRIIEPFTDPSWVNASDPNATVYCAVAADSNDCKGHHPWDLTHFSTSVWNNETYTFDKEVYLTNAEFYDALDPRDYKMPFIYDNFEWTHCDQEGYYFGSVGANADDYSLPNSFSIQKSKPANVISPSQLQ